jgi:hypothetical protein
MRYPAPYDRDGHRCLLSHHPRSQPPQPARPRQPLQETEASLLLAYLATISDPRGRRGRRHPLVAILAIAAAAVLAGARSMAASPSGLRMPRSWSGWRVAPPCWARPLGRALRGHHPPHAGPPGRRRLGEVIGAWLADRDRPDQRRRRRAVAVDAKTLRGARRDGRAVHLLAAMEHATPRVLAQRAVTAPPARCRRPAAAGRLGPGRGGGHR